MPTVQINIATANDDIRVVKRDTNGTVYPPNGTTSPFGTTTDTAIQARRALEGTPRYAVENPLLRFDSGSVLPDDCTITSATLKLRRSNGADVDGLSLVGEYYSTFDGTLNAARDYTNTPSDTAFSAVTLASLSTNGIKTFTLLSPDTNISKTGYTGFRLHITQRASDAAPTGDNWFQFITYETVDQASFPRAQLEITYTENSETMRPTSTTQVTGLTPTDSASATAIIDDDPDAGGTDFLTGTDPSGVTANDSARYADAEDGTTPATFAGQLTNPANAVGSSEASQATSTGATQNSDYGTYFGFDETAIAAAIPSNATINSVALEVRDWVSNANRSTQGYRLDSAAGTQIANEQTITNLTTTVPGAGVVKNTFTGWSTIPTRAQLVAAGFRVRVRMRRTASQACTYSLDWLRLVINYSTPASTTATEVRAVMGNPTNTLQTGATSGEVRLQVRKLGSGSDPSVRAEVREGGTLRATPIADTAVSTTAAGGTVLPGNFDHASVNDLTNLDIWIVSAGAAGGLIEVGAVEWNGLISSGVSDNFPLRPDFVQKLLIRR